MKSTPLGIPYVEPDDKVSDIQVVIAALAEKVDELLTGRNGG